MKKNKNKLLILTGIIVVSMSVTSFALSNRNLSESPSKPDITDVNKKANLSISKAELNIVAEKIFQNEAGGKKDELVYWNTGENFP